MFRKPFSTEGRIRRLEYGLTLIIVTLVQSFTRAIMESASGDSSAASLAILIGLICTWIMVAQGVKRTHDLNQSGWWFLFPGWAIVILFWKGDVGLNRYGPDPKA